jgi:hypothetical protein
MRGIPFCHIRAPYQLWVYERDIFIFLFALSIFIKIVAKLSKKNRNSI